MLTRTFAVAAVVAFAAVSAPALAATTAGSVTATGTAQVRVKPKNRHNQQSIKAAVDAAKHAGIKQAINDAKEYAEQYASAAGLTLGPIVAVSDVVSSFGPYGPLGIGSFLGPFGPGRFCGTLRQPVFKVVKGRHKLVRFKKVHRCFVPSFETTALAVTYSAT